MKPSTTAIMTAAGASSASAMVPFFNTTSTQPFHCPSPFGLFCAGPSMSQNLLMQCTMGNPSPINCIEHTAAQAPIDDYNARCYESAPSAGDAACAKEGTVYPLSGTPFPLPAGSDNASLPETPTLTASAGAETAFPAPANLTAFPMPTQHFPAPPPPPAGLASLPKASLPGYVTTVTMGTQTRWHTVFSNCGNGTMLFGTATSSTFASWQTGSIPGELASSEFQPSSPSAAAPATIPCDPSTSYVPQPTPTPEPEATTTETSTVSYAIDPTDSTFSQSWIHPTDYATVTVVAAASNSFAWSSGEVATPTTSTSTVTASEAVPSMYPSATSSAGFQSGAGADGEGEESSGAGRRREAPRVWVAVVVVVGVVVWGV